MANLAKSVALPLLNLIVKKPIYLLLLIALLVAGWFVENSYLRPAMSYMGVPQLQSAPNGNQWSHILRKEAFMLEYSEGLKNPLWVVYQVKQKAPYESGKRPSSFSQDSRTLAGIRHDDYTGSGYDRGHMAPNFAIATSHGRNAQLETFLMTNISPQKPDLNRKAWQRLEEIVATELAPKYGDLWVFTGPIFADKSSTLKSSAVAIPKAFFKIIVRPYISDQQSAQVLAFIFPQKVKGDENLLKFVTTVDEIEAQTGIDFMADFEDNFEGLLESSKVPEVWNFSAYSNRPSRY